MAEHADAPDAELSAAAADPDVNDESGSAARAALVVGLTAVVALAGVGGWLGYRAYAEYQVQQERELFLDVGRQTALSLTSIDHTRAEADVQRILDSATGAFHDDFQRRSTSFIEVVRTAQSTSEGTITEAGLESVIGDEAQVLVAVNVDTSNAAAEQQELRAWRMRMTVQKTADDAAKVSNVEFVP